MIEGLLQTAHAAAAHNDIPRALAALGEYVNHNPEHASAILSFPSLSSIQSEAKELLHNMTLEARTEAVRLVGAAGMVVDAATRHPQGVDGGAVLAVAERFIESGQLANYIRAAELSQAVIAFYNGAPPEVAWNLARRKQPAAKAGRRPFLNWAAAMWRKVPLLVLLLGWTALGVAGGSIAWMVRVMGGELNPSTLQTGFDMWAIGFLALVVLQFIMRVTVFR